MQPTQYFRWKPVQELEPEACAAIQPGYTESNPPHMTHLDKYFVLQQWWEPKKSFDWNSLEKPTGEWRNVPIDWTGNNEPPTYV